MGAAGSYETPTRLPEFQRAVIFNLNGKETNVHSFAPHFTSSSIPLLLHSFRNTTDSNAVGLLHEHIDESETGS
jgi:hypothetical protein